MSSDHQHNTPPPTSTELHRPPSSSTPKSLPNTPSPMKPNPSEPNSTPESRLAAALGRAFFNIPPSSFPSTTPLLRTSSDADSSITTTTPPMIPSNNPLRRTLSDSTPPDYDHRLPINSNNSSKNPLRRTLSHTSDCQAPHKTPRLSSSSPHGKQSPQSEVVMSKIEDMVREIGQRCLEIMRHQEEEEEKEQHVKDEIPETEGKEEECVGVERLKNGDMRFELGCSCGKRFEMLIKHNGYCFYRLT